MSPNSASSRPALGRRSGSLARQLPISHRSSPGRSPSSAGLLTSRYISRALDPEPNGPCPVAPYTSTAPRLKMSLGGPRSWPRACSGDMNPGAAKSAPAAVAREMAKSATRGPPRASSTLDGLTFPCTRPAACSARRPSASPVASARTVRAGTGPRSLTVWASDGPGTYGAASQGAGASRSASTTDANAPPTFRAAATSARNPGSTARPARTAVSTTRSPLGEQARNRPSWLSCPSSWYGPIAPGASVVSGATTLIPTPRGG
jgi:hypothetical protein